MKLLMLIISFLSFSLFSCKEDSLYIYFHNADLFIAEKLWLEEIINELPECDFNTNNAIDVSINFFSYWDYEEHNFNNYSDFIIISKTWFVPRENSLAGRKNTSLELCMEGKEYLIPLSELTPPDIALRVDGLAAGDEGYPLVLSVGIRIDVVQKEGESKRRHNNRLKKAAELENFLIELSKPLINEKPSITWISSAGDVMLGRNAGNILLNQGPRNLFGGTFDILYDADVTVINLEGPLSARGTRAQKTFTFRFEPPRELASALKNAGIDAVLFANNHTFDFGDVAFLDTLDYLEEVNIGVLGAGRNMESILQPWRFTKENFSGNFWGIASFPRENSGYDGLSDIATADKPGFLMAARGGAEALMERFEENSLNVVLFHGGAEWSASPVPATRELYTNMARAGADLIIGSHPHIVQGFEWIDNEKLIFWSLGNFIFSGMQETGGGDEGLLIRLGYLGKQPVYIEAFAVDLIGPRVELAPDEKLSTFYNRSRALLQ